MNETRIHIEPDEKYSSNDLRQAEKNAERVLDILPSAVVERTGDCIQINYGEQRGIVVLVTAEAIELRFPTVEWTMGSYEPTASSRLWKRVEYHEMDDMELEFSLNDALKQRRGNLELQSIVKSCFWDGLYNKFYHIIKFRIY